jgi:serine/threonine protein kinase
VSDEGSVSKLKEINIKLADFIGHKNACLNHFKVLGYLGEGSYAIVNLATDSQRKEKVALKIYEKKTLIVKKRFENLLVC